MRIIRVGRVEWRSLGQHDEADDTSSDNVDSFSLVRLSHVDFRSHVTLCAELSLQLSLSVAAHDRSCETKVRNFEFEVFFKHKIFGLEVTMADTCLVHVVQSLEHLLGVKPTDWLAKLTPERDEIEQLATAAKFKNNVLHFFGPLLWVLLNARALLDKVDDARMTKLL